MESVHRRRLALVALFFVPGMAMASWVTRTPEIRDALGASIADMGLVLLALSLGSTSGLLASGPAVGRWGTRPVLVVGESALVVGTLVVGAGTASGATGAVALGLLLFGSGMGGAEIAMNVEGAAVEQELGRPTLPALHGAYSVGTVAGALSGLAATSVGLSVEGHLVLVAALSVPVAWWALVGIPPAVPGREEGSEGGARGVSVWRDSRLLMIGVIVLALALAEGAANDWLPLLMDEAHGLSPSQGSLVYLTFAVAMATGRLVGGRFIARFGNAVVLAASASVGAVGLALVVFVDDVWVAGGAVALWGLGASLGFPIAISAAGGTGPDAARRVSVVATLGYLAFLAGPPVLGFAGEHWGLRSAMGIVLVGVVVAVLLAPALREPRALGAGGVRGGRTGATEPSSPT